ncbi:MAG: type II toxin-antitoxin system RelE/ParE family toxin, partial [Pseudolabrys sp.]
SMPAGLAKEVVELMAKLVGDADDMNVPGLHLHPLKGSLSGYWAVSVSGNWRVTFRFDNGHAVDVDYMDYH